MKLCFEALKIFLAYTNENQPSSDKQIVIVFFFFTFDCTQHFENFKTIYFPVIFALFLQTFNFGVTKTQIMDLGQPLQKEKYTS